MMHPTEARYTPTSLRTGTWTSERALSDFRGRDAYSDSTLISRVRAKQENDARLYASFHSMFFLCLGFSAVRVFLVVIYQILGI